MTKEEIKTLRDLLDRDIDYSDIPEKTDWSNAVVGKFYKPRTPGAQMININGGSLPRTDPNSPLGKLQAKWGAIYEDHMKSCAICTAYQAEAFHVNNKRCEFGEHLWTVDYWKEALPLIEAEPPVRHFGCC